ncbi:MAG: hypothetical protein ACOX1P_18385 [Thermoguttaceae bacterium]
MSIIRSSIDQSNDTLLIDAGVIADEAAYEFEQYVHSLAVGAFGDWGAYFFSQCASELPDECFDRSKFAPELLVAKPPGPVLPLTPLQRAIMKALEGRALTKQALANEVSKGEGRMFYRPGGLLELRLHGLVDHRKGVGFFRPDAPPPDSVFLS